MLISTGMLDSFKIMDGRHHIRKRPPLIFFHSSENKDAMSYMQCTTFSCEPP